MESAMIYALYMAISSFSGALIKWKQRQEAYTNAEVERQVEIIGNILREIIETNTVLSKVESCSLVMQLIDEMTFFCSIKRPSWNRRDSSRFRNLENLIFGPLYHLDSSLPKPIHYYQEALDKNTQ